MNYLVQGEKIRSNIANFHLIKPSIAMDRVPLKDLQFLENLNLIMTENFQCFDFNRQVAAKLLAISHRQLHRKLDKFYQLSFTEFLGLFRLKMAIPLIKNGCQIGQVCDLVGFNSVSYFSRCFKTVFGITPKKFQLQGV